MPDSPICYRGPRDGEPTHSYESLEHRLRLLGDAVAVLACGPEQRSIGDIEDGMRATAAQQAHRIVMAESLTTVGIEH